MDSTNQIDKAQDKAAGDETQPSPATSETTAYPSDAPVNMVLAAIAYCTQIGQELDSEGQGWQLAWSAIETGGNSAYVASYNGGAEYAVAIRGSVLSFSWEAFQDWFEQDFNILRQVAWGYPLPGENTAPDTAPAMISRGAFIGLTNLQNLPGHDANGNPVTLIDFLTANVIDKNLPLRIVGHSLGGGLTTVFAMWLNYVITSAGKTPNLRIMTFAAPAVGNTTFADSYDAAFSANSFRIYNSLDIVPLSAASIIEMGALYFPHPFAPDIETGVVDEEKITLPIAGIAGIVALFEAGYNSYYQQTNRTAGNCKLDGTIQGTPQSDDLSLWFAQVGDQHNRNTYLSMLGGSGFTCADSLETGIVRKMIGTGEIKRPARE